MLRAILGTVNFAVGILFMSLFGGVAAQEWVAMSEKGPFDIFGVFFSVGKQNPLLLVAFGIGLVAFVFASIMIRVPAGLLSRRLARRGGE